MGIDKHERHGLRVLCIDDEPHVVTLKCQVLEAAGYTVSASTSARDAIDKLNKGGYDAVVTDWRLGDANGRPIIQAAKSKKNIPVIVVSGYVAEAVAAAEPLADVYLEKPVHFEELIELVDDEIRKVKTGASEGGARPGKDQANGQPLVSLGRNTTESRSRDDIVLATAIHDLKNEIALMGSAVNNIRPTVTDDTLIAKDIVLIHRCVVDSSLLLGALRDCLSNSSNFDGLVLLILDTVRRHNGLGIIAHHEIEFLRRQLDEKTEHPPIADHRRMQAIYESLLAVVVCGMRANFDQIDSVIGRISSTGIGNENEELLEELGRIRRGIVYSTSILGGRLLRLLEHGVDPPRPLFLAPLLREITGVVAGRLHPNIRIELVLLDTLKKTKVLAEREGFVSILLELCKNAARAIGENSGLIQLAASARSGFVYVAVTDSGPGIDAKLKDVLLHEQVESAQGDGLGLYLSSQMARSFGGNLELYSTGPTGSRFKIKLRKIRVAAAAKRK